MVGIHTLKYTWYNIIPGMYLYLHHTMHNISYHTRTHDQSPKAYKVYLVPYTIPRIQQAAVQRLLYEYSSSTRIYHDAIGYICSTIAVLLKRAVLYLSSCYRLSCFIRVQCEHQLQPRVVVTLPNRARTLYVPRIQQAAVQHHR